MEAAQHQKPSTRDLQRHVVPHVREWESLCIELNVDQDGSVLGDIKRCCKDDSKACCREVLLRWLRGEGEGPPTWGTMIDCLQRIGAEEAIADIEENVLKTKSTKATSTESSSNNPQQLQKDEVKQLFPPMAKYIHYDITKKPRQYQLELATPGMQGKNCIVCAPTGTGKTFVAALIVANHLNQRQGKGKVVFVVPTQPLAKQQQKSIKESIPLARVACCVGDDTGGSVRMAITDNEIVVCTAGKLWDELQEMNDRSLKFTHFSLMVIDECHNARKSSPQANVMTKYLKEKLREDNIKLPQVLGLTASPGAGDKRVPTLDSTYDYLISLCALMDATEGIVCVKSSKDELEQHTKKSTSTLKHCRGRDTANDEFIKVVLRAMKEWEKVIKVNTNFDRWDQRYETYIRQNKKIIEDNPEPMREKLSILEYLLCLSQVLSTYMKLRLEDAVSVLNGFTLCSSEEMEKKIMASLEALKENLTSIKPVPNPLLEEIKEALVSRFVESPSSHAIVFASTKKQASCVCDWISKLPPDLYLKPRVVVGHTAETGPGMTDPEKEEALAGFREGRYNILVATSVLEEGIDIPACNLVIRYEHVTNEIAKVQAEGRARAENSEGITIVSNTSNKHLQELLNEEKGQIVIEAMEYLPSGDYLLQKIKAEQEQIMQKEDMKAWLRLEKMKESDREKVILKCKKCKMVACCGSDLYTLQLGGFHIVVPDKRFREEKLRIKPHPRPRSDPEGYSKKEKIHCVNCDSDWGVVRHMDE
ncbi:hypothetical protein EMCRGX_G011992 [Ephydatia muelleri]